MSSNIREKLHYDEASGDLAFQITGDVQANIDRNNRERTAGNNGYGPTREWHKAASIPVTVQYEWIQKFGVDPLRKENEALLKRLLNSNEYRYLRTSEIIL